MPPTKKKACQPKWDCSVVATTEGRMPPTARPMNMMMISVARNRLGAYSAFSATVFGSRPPRPIPETKRRIRIALSPGAATIISVNRP